MPRGLRDRREDEGLPGLPGAQARRPEGRQLPATEEFNPITWVGKVTEPKKPATAAEVARSTSGDEADEPERRSASGQARPWPASHLSHRRVAGFRAGAPPI